MGKLDGAKGLKTFQNVAKISNEKANLITIIYYEDSVLLDYPKNNEDITMTEDIEKSIDEIGFTDPLEITDFGMEPGKFMIVAGHRRRAAGRKKGMKSFPCILRHFNSDSEVYNYVLLSNAHRDSAKDPLLFSRRYKMHEEYLKEVNFTGSFREEIAKRLGLKLAQADRYNQMNSVILPIWDMVQAGKVGMSSITDSGLYTHSPEQQEEILNIMHECMDNEQELTRPIIKKIVTGYREGKRTWLEIIQIEMDLSEDNRPVNYQNDAPVKMIENQQIETVSETNETSEKSTVVLNSEINHDVTNTENLMKEDSQEETQENENSQEEKTASDESISDNSFSENGNNVVDFTQKLGDRNNQEESQENQESQDENEKKQPLTEEEKRLSSGEKIIKNLASLDGLLNNFYSFASAEQAESTIINMSTMIKILLVEMESVGSKYKKENVFNKELKDITREIINYKESGK